MNKVCYIPGPGLMPGKLIVRLLAGLADVHKIPAQRSEGKINHSDIKG